jgi:hypothetical protein
VNKAIAIGASPEQILDEMEDVLQMHERTAKNRLPSPASLPTSVEAFASATARICAHSIGSGSPDYLSHRSTLRSELHKLLGN